MSKVLWALELAVPRAISLGPESKMEIWKLDSQFWQPKADVLSVGILLFQDNPHGLLDVDQETSGRSWSDFVM